MNANNLLFCTIFFISSLSLGIGVSDVGNGGDVVACFDYANEKLFTLDYVLGKSRFPDVKIAKVAETFQSLDRIKHLIKAKIPSLSSSYNEFIDLILNPISSYKHVWLQSESPLNDIDDENISRVPTYICPLNMYSAFKGELRQAVIRQVYKFNGTEKTRYLYDKQIFDYLHQKAPLQLSFLLVHEWLWSLNLQVSENRNINFFLHSDQFEKLSVNKVKERLNNLGLRLQK